MRASIVVILAFVGVVVVGGVAAGLFWSGHSAQNLQGSAGAPGASQPQASGAAQAQKRESVDEELTERLRQLCERAGGRIGVAVVHVESGRTVAFEGARALPLYSVFKLPLAITVLKEVEDGRLRLEQKVRVTPEEAAPGAQANTDLWRKPVERTVAELLDLSVRRSDNTSTDKLLQLIGGAGVVTARMRSFGFTDIDIHSSTREFAARRDRPNTGTARDLAQLLVRLQKGELLQPPQTALLIGFMERATTGARRLRGDLPAGTRVADKTGTGEAGSTTNDVGLITLPGGKGHLAIAVLLSGSKLSEKAQEKLIAELARAAYDAHA
ncbi:MAG TPA: class A beta-lactamase [Pyrinomonadaceae bacterium]|nr:class A beta-lactamase [Pyrinomonadaceae bacterium]